MIVDVAFEVPGAVGLGLEGVEFAAWGEADVKGYIVIGYLFRGSWGGGWWVGA